jgi:hypothetical protein
MKYYLIGEKMENKMPVFVKIDEYKDVLDILSVVKQKVVDSKKLLNNLRLQTLYLVLVYLFFYLKLIPFQRIVYLLFSKSLYICFQY